MDIIAKTVSGKTFARFQMDANTLRHFKRYLHLDDVPGFFNITHQTVVYALGNGWYEIRCMFGDPVVQINEAVKRFNLFRRDYDRQVTNEIRQLLQNQFTNGFSQAAEKPKFSQVEKTEFENQAVRTFNLQREQTAQTPPPKHKPVPVTLLQRLATRINNKYHN